MTRKTVKLTLEDFGTLLICATRFAQQSGNDAQKIVDISKKHVFNQSLKTLNVCLQDQKFYEWMIEGKSEQALWNDWYNTVREAKKHLFVSYYHARSAVKGAKQGIWCYFNPYTYFDFLQNRCGVNTAVSSNDIDEYMKQHNSFSTMDIVFSRVDKNKAEEYANQYIDYVLSVNGDDNRYFDHNFEESSWKMNDSIYAVSAADFSELSRYALKYTMGRRTYMPSLVRDDIVTPHLQDLNNSCLNQMLEDTALQKQNGNYGDPRIDKPEWLQWVNTLNTEKEKRAKQAS